MLAPTTAGSKEPSATPHSLTELFVVCLHHFAGAGAATTSEHLRSEPFSSFCFCKACLHSRQLKTTPDMLDMPQASPQHSSCSLCLQPPF